MCSIWKIETSIEISNAVWKNIGMLTKRIFDVSKNIVWLKNIFTNGRILCLLKNISWFKNISPFWKIIRIENTLGDFKNVCQLKKHDVSIYWKMQAKLHSKLRVTVILTTWYLSMRLKNIFLNFWRQTQHVERQEICRKRKVEKCKAVDREIVVFKNQNKVLLILSKLWNVSKQRSNI